MGVVVTEVDPRNVYPSNKSCFSEGALVKRPLPPVPTPIHPPASANSANFRYHSRSLFKFPCKMKGLKKIKKRLGLGGTHSAGRSVGLNNLPPLVFHSVHGQNVQLSSRKDIATRVDSFCNAITFTNRPINLGEKVYIRLLDVSINWSGAIRFGFTSHNPTALRCNLPKYACPDLSNRDGCWAKAVSDRYATRDALLHFYYNAAGEVHFGINGEEKGRFFSGVDVRSPLWALVDIYGNSIKIQLVDFVRLPLNNANGWDDESDLSEQLQSCSLHASSPNINETSARADDYEPSFIRHRTPPVQNIYEPTPRADQRNNPRNSAVPFAPLQFHTLKGSCVRFTNNRYEASRSDQEFCNGYVFSSRCLGINECISVQILSTEPMYVGGLGFGLTSCNFSALTPNDLPDDADALLNRPEYWVICKDVGNSPATGDELSFWITSEGEVKMRKNRENSRTLCHVERGIRLCPFFDIYGSTLTIRAFIGTGNNNQITPRRSRALSPGISYQNESNSRSQYSAEVVPNSHAQVQSQTFVSSPNVSTNQVHGQTTNFVFDQSGVMLVIPVASRCVMPVITPTQPSPSSRPSRILSPTRSNPMISANRNACSQMSASRIPNTYERNSHQIYSESARTPSDLTRKTRSCGDWSTDCEDMQNWAKMQADNSQNAASNSEPSMCSVCFEKPIDAALYTCGHMCTCYSCAKQLHRGPGDGHCPICRAPIRDVVRIYKA